jgi:hypothetical protein
LLIVLLNEDKTCYNGNGEILLEVKWLLSLMFFILEILSSNTGREIGFGYKIFMDSLFSYRQVLAWYLKQGTTAFFTTSILYSLW